MSSGDTLQAPAHVLRTAVRLQPACSMNVKTRGNDSHGTNQVDTLCRMTGRIRGNGTLDIVDSKPGGDIQPTRASSSSCALFT